MAPQMNADKPSAAEPQPKDKRRKDPQIFADFADFEGGNKSGKNLRRAGRNGGIVTQIRR